MKYKIYKHTFKSSNKSYIGYTSLKIEERLHKHLTNSLSGIDTHFYRAIRKYGINDIKSECLYETEIMTEAINKEKEFIKKFDTFKNGYNMTIGGDGGDIINSLPEEKFVNYINQLIKRTQGKNNPRYCGKTDDEIVEMGCVFIRKFGIFKVRKWYEFAEQNGLPKNFSKFRFNGGGFSEFKKRICEKLNINIKDIDYIKTNEHRNKLAKKSSEWRWYNDGNKDIRIHKDNEKNIDLNIYKKGRVKK